MIIAVVGLSHKTAPVEIREKLAFPEKELPEALRRLVSDGGVGEGMIVSTCNRVEVYAVGDDETSLLAGVVRFLSGFRQFPEETLRPHIYLHAGSSAVRHVMRVSCSLDSMVMGEPQILGQVKDAYDRALEAGTTGKILNELMKKNFQAAKTVRTDTGIARSAVSISFAAVELARKIFNDLAGKSVMIIGAGEMSELAVKHLVSQGVTDILVANRTFERAVELAEAFHGSAIRFEDLTEHLVMSDIVISSTGAPHFILTADMLRKVIYERKNRPMFLIDIAVPRDIDPKVNDLDNVYLYDIDNLAAVVEANVRERQKEAEKAGEIIEREVGVFGAWLESLEVVPTIVGLRRKIEAIRDTELEKALGRLGELNPRDLETVKALASGIVNKILHEPTAVLKRESKGGNAAAYVEATRKLFGITGHEASGNSDNDGKNEVNP
jgi:glutamyl-tRNA reductase